MGLRSLSKNILSFCLGAVHKRGLLLALDYFEYLSSAVDDEDDSLNSVKMVYYSQFM